MHYEFMSHHNFTRSSNTFGQHTHFPTGKLPKMNFPKFEGENPRLWKSRCENYFEMYLVDSYMWVKIATMHFEGQVALWLQFVNHIVQKTSWADVCSWIHDCFGRGQHEILIRQLYHIKQTNSVQDYVDKFCELIDQLQAYSKNVDHVYYTTRFIFGLRHDIKFIILVQRPKDLDTACSLVLLWEESAATNIKVVKNIEHTFSTRPFSKGDFSCPDHHCHPRKSILLTQQPSQLGKNINLRKIELQHCQLIGWLKAYARGVERNGSRATNV
jgi:hypothetical protein